MTATLAAPPVATTWAIATPRLLAGLDDSASLDLPTHLATHGPLPAVDLPRLLAALDEAPIHGRGGGGFPLAVKIRALRGPRRRVVVNGLESEPVSGKDRTLLRRTPHLVLDGALAVAAAVGAPEVTVAVRDDESAAALAGAAAARRAPVVVSRLRAGFVAGEARTLVRALDGGPALPPGRRTPSSDHGDLVSNAETFAQLAVLLRLGPWRFAATGTRTEPGTTLLTVGGAVTRPGVVEVPLGTPLGIVLTAARAAEPVAAVIGGYSGSWVSADPTLPLSRAGLTGVGGSLGAGSVLVVDASTCALGELAGVAGWLAAQSAGQCGPCRFGLPALAHDVAALAAGIAPALPTAFRHADLVAGRGACSHPDAAARFVRSGLRLLDAEVQRHRADGSCGRPVRGRLPLGDPR